MYCGKCGAENDNGARFCKGCGLSLGNDSIQESKTSPSSEEGKSISIPKVDVGSITDKAKALPKKFIAIALAIVVALIAIIVVASESAKTIDLNKYLEIESEGYDGFGKARTTIDWKAIRTKYGDKISFTSSAKNEMGGLMGVTPIDKLQDYVSVRLEDNSKLSNGSVVEYKWDIDEDLSKELNCKLKYKDGAYTVTGLTEVGKFDAFADMTVEFSGIAPNGKANINYLGSELNYYDFDCDKTNGLSNGDTVKVTIDENQLAYYAENLGKVPEALEKEFKVEGLESYVTRISDVDDEAMKSMQQQAEDTYNANVAKNWGEGESLESLTCIGNYLLTSKSSDTWGSNNYMFLIYKAQVRNSYTNDKGESYNKVNDIYWYIRYDNLMVGSDGKTVVNVSSYDTPYDRFTIDSGVDSGWWSTKQWYYNGYQTLDELYKTAIVSNIDSYNHEDNIEENVVIEEEKMNESHLTNEIIKLYRSRIQSYLDNETYISIPYEAISKDDVGEGSEVFFSLKDLNKDGIDELLLIYSSQGYDEAANVFSTEMISEPCIALVSYYDDNNNLCYHDDMVDLNTIKIFRLNGKQEEVIEKYEVDTVDDFETFVYYHVDDTGNKTEITEEEYKKVENIIPRSNSFEKYSITEENLNKYLPLE